MEQVGWAEMEVAGASRPVHKGEGTAPAKIITVPEFPFEEFFFNYRYRPGMAVELITNGNFSNKL